MPVNREHVNWKEHEHIAVVTISRPPVNALNSQVLNELIDAFEDLRQEKTIAAAVLCGAGTAFVAGADVKEIPSLDGESGLEFSALGQRATGSIYSFPRPVIAAIEGMALGGGCEVALACDIRVASETALFGQPEVNLGVIAGAGGTQRLSRLVGIGRAKMLLYTGQTIDAKEALRIGLVEMMVPAGDALKEALAVAAKIRMKGPLAISLTKESIDQGAELPLDEGLRIELNNFGRVCATEDKNEGVRAFLEKRKAVFRGK